MARTHAERQAASILKYGRTLYERRKESGQARGLSLSQIRGHAKAGEQKPSVIKAALQAKTPSADLKARPAVKSSKVPEDLRGTPRVTYIGGNKTITARSELSAYKAVQEAANSNKRVIVTEHFTDGTQRRVYQSPVMYSEGITASYLLDLMESSGNSFDEQLDDDYSAGSCGPGLPEAGPVAVYTVQFVDNPYA